MHIELNNVERKSEGEFDPHDLICPVCMSIPNEPYLSSCCRRVFCAKDANRNRYENGCPFCREPNYTFALSVEHKKLLDKYTTTCECSERVLPQYLSNHRERCLKITFLCPHSVCRENHETKTYNSQDLVNHMARAHCDEVPILGSTFIRKTSAEPYKRAAKKHEELVSTLYSSLYPKMIDVHIENNVSSREKPAAFKCPKGHDLVEADAAKRKRKNGTGYSSPGFNCDVCHKNFTEGTSWHCSCSDTGFDKCVACLTFELYSINDDVLRKASEDHEVYQQQQRSRIHSMFRLSSDLFRLLANGAENMDEDDIFSVLTRADNDEEDDD